MQPYPSWWKVNARHAELLEKYAIRHTHDLVRAVVRDGVGVDPRPDLACEASLRDVYAFCNKHLGKLTLHGARVHEELGVTLHGKKPHCVVRAEPPGQAARAVLAADGWCCPLTGEPFQDPVVAADGYTYERHALCAWWNQGHLTSPVTGVLLPVGMMLPNHLVRCLLHQRD